MEIVNQVNAYKDKRPVLVFFKDVDALDTFFKTSHCQPLSPVLLDPRVTSDRDRTVSIAMSGAGVVTLLTRDFGRGTDFMCSDDDVRRDGGVHVIQTFLSEELAEELQIKGRTARQDNPGSYCMVLNAPALADFGITPADVADMKTKTKKLYKFIHGQRVVTFDASYPEKVKTVQISAVEHKKALDLIEHLILCGRNPASANYVHDHLLGLNCCMDAVDGAHSARRTVILLDATYSMNQALQLTKAKLRVVFERAFNIISQHLGPTTGFQMQLGVYRNYNVDHEWKLFQATDFESSADNLVNFLDGVRVDGGWGHEAMELGFAHALEMHLAEPIGQIIVVGDAPPNDRHEVDHHRLHKNQFLKFKRWNEAVYFDEQHGTVTQEGIRVSTVFLPTQGDAVWRQNFHNVATQDGFKEDLDVTHADAGELLTKYITRSILDLLGREKGGSAAKDMLEMYERLYGVGHSK
jgi:hypothetical protein